MPLQMLLRTQLQLKLSLLSVPCPLLLLLQPRATFRRLQNDHLLASPQRQKRSNASASIAQWKAASNTPCQVVGAFVMEAANAACFQAAIRVALVRNKCVLLMGVARDAPLWVVTKAHKALVCYFFFALFAFHFITIVMFVYTKLLASCVVWWLSYSSGNKCITHGGGKRCGFEGCKKIAQRGGRCSAHGGGRRCSEPGCTKHAQGRTLRCVKHGGGRRCQVAGCPRSAAGRTMKCVKHGGGTRCTVEGCNRLAKSGGKCRGHGGGRRCAYVDPGSNKSCTK